MGYGQSSFLTSASNFYIEPKDGLFDVNPENDRASPSVKNPHAHGGQLAGLRPMQSKQAIVFFSCQEAMPIDLSIDHNVSKI